jgi:protein-S-isoprenylcysteine O-methyltransferase Ste14
MVRDEHRLEARFGVAYAAYRKKVNRWIPGIL